MRATVPKTDRVECSVEGCNRKAAESGTCFKKHRGYKYCTHEDAPNKLGREGFVLSMVP